MEWVETTGKSVAEALEAALTELGVDERDADVVVVHEPRAGLFGIGRLEARIRVRVRPAPPRPKRPQRGRRTNAQRGDSGERSPDSKARSGESTRVSGDASSNGNTSASRSKRRSSTRNRQGDGSQRASRQVAATPETNVREARQGVNEEEIMSVEQQAVAVTEFIQGIVDRFGVAAETSARIEDNYIFVDVTGDDLGLLIGQRGATIDALQELARTVVQHRTEDQIGRVILDVAGFRAKRAAALSSFVQRVAEEVKSTGVAQALEPMGAPDRKIVHDTVNDIEGVETTSEGVDPRRYVVIRAAVEKA